MLKLNRSGDTIVEVMIVLAVLGLAIGISYATANRSLLNARQAQENSASSELVQSQIEQLRTQMSNGDTSNANDVYNVSQPFCMNSSGNVVLEPHINPADQSTWTNYSNYDPACVSSFYHFFITYAPGNSTFTVKAIWDDVLGQGSDSVTNSYRMHLISNASQGVAATGVTCWDGSTADSSADCPPEPNKTCWDGSVIPENNACPPLPQFSISVVSKSCGTTIDPIWGSAIYQATLKVTGTPGDNVNLTTTGTMTAFTTSIFTLSSTDLQIGPDGTATMETAPYGTYFLMSNWTASATDTTHAANAQVQICP